MSRQTENGDGPEQAPFVIIKQNGGRRISVYRRSGSTTPEWDEFKKFRSGDQGETCGAVLFTSREDAEKRMKTFAKQTVGTLRVLPFTEAFTILAAPQ